MDPRGWTGWQLLYGIEYTLGGKNVFSRGLSRGAPARFYRSRTIHARKPGWTRLQVWSRTVRTIGRARLWADPLLTSMRPASGCHVSQLNTKYDAATDSYQTAWPESGVNWERAQPLCRSRAHVQSCAGRAIRPEWSHPSSKLTRRRDRISSAEPPSVGEVELWRRAPPRPMGAIIRVFQSRGIRLDSLAAVCSR
jgi:hypothetical protein